MILRFVNGDRKLARATARCTCICIISLLVLVGCSSTRATAPAACETRVVYVVDGDTVDVAVGGLVVRCRLVRVDTPERGEPGFREAGDFVRAWLAAADRVRVEQATGHRDSWNRTLVAVWRDSDPVDLSAALIAAGHGRVFSP